MTSKGTVKMDRYQCDPCEAMDIYVDRLTYTQYSFLVNTRHWPNTK
jgi:hypothetical protein